MSDDENARGRFASQSSNDNNDNGYTDEPLYAERPPSFTNAADVSESHYDRRTVLGYGEVAEGIYDQRTLATFDEEDEENEDGTRTITPSPPPPPPPPPAVFHASVEDTSHMGVSKLDTLDMLRGAGGQPGGVSQVRASMKMFERKAEETQQHQPRQNLGAGPVGTSRKIFELNHSQAGNDQAHHQFKSNTLEKVLKDPQRLNAHKSGKHSAMLGINAHLKQQQSSKPLNGMKAKKREAASRDLVSEVSKLPMAQHPALVFLSLFFFSLSLCIISCGVLSFLCLFCNERYTEEPLRALLLACCRDVLRAFRRRNATRPCRVMPHAQNTVFHDVL